MSDDASRAEARRPSVDDRGGAALDREAIDALRDGRSSRRSEVADLLAAYDVTPRRVGIGVVVLVVVVAAIYLVVRTPGAPPEDILPMASLPTVPQPSTTVPGPVIVHVAGAVATPGLQTLVQGSRVADAVDAAGGLAVDADPSRINLAAELVDGQRVYVPAVGEDVLPTVAGGDASAGADGAPGPVNLNSASADLLDSLPGVGPATAGAIVDHRDGSGGFTSVDDLLDVRGIGPAKLEALRDLVTV